MCFVQYLRVCLCCAVQCHHEGSRFCLCQLEKELKSLPTLRPECFGSLQAKIEASHVHVVSSATSTGTSGCSVYIDAEDVCSLTGGGGGGKGKKRKQDMSQFAFLLFVPLYCLLLSLPCCAAGQSEHVRGHCCQAGPPYLFLEQCEWDLWTEYQGAWGVPSTGEEGRGRGCGDLV